jgi:hypothetical protein
MPELHPCEQCFELIAEKADDFLRVCVFSGNGDSRIGLVHEGGWKEYKGNHPNLELA